MTQGISYEGNTLVGVVDKTTFEVPSFVEIIFGASEKQYAFMESPEITEVTFQEGSNLTTIQKYAFYNLKTLEGICLSSCKNLKTIGDYAFAECSALKYVYFPESLKTLNQYCFSKTTNLENVSFPASVSTIGNAAFEHSGIKNVTFAKGIQIKSFVWRSFGRITVDTFPIPAGVTNIHASCFEQANIRSVVVEEGSTNFFVSNWALLNSDNTKVVYFPRLQKQCSLPHTVTEILGSSFAFSKIESITFPKNLQIIGSYAFDNANSLKEVVFPASLKLIETYAFSGTGVEKITFEEPANISSIGSYAFSGSKMTNITIPESVTSIGSYCFNWNQKLKYIKLPSNLISLDGGIFTNCPPDIVIDFGAESNYIIEHFLFMDRSKTFISQYIGTDLSTIIIPETIKEIKASAFLNKQEITNVTFLGNCLTNIGEKAFSGCTSLKIINIPNSLTSIGISAFSGCTSLESISLGNSINQIVERCFYNCKSLKSFELPDEITIIKDSGFALCTNLTSITIKETSKLKTIEANAFYLCSSLTSITFPPSVTTIGNEVFLLSGITSISFSEQSTITEISDYAFSGASNLCLINSFPSSVTKLNYQCFDRTSFEIFVLPNSIEKLDDKCFSNCLKLKTFVIESNSALTYIGRNIFQGCTSLATISANSNHFSDENGVLFNKEKDKLIIFPPASSIRLFSFPIKVKTISYGALSGCTNIELVLLPEGLITIDEKAFQGCRNLKTINIPSTVTQIYSDAFEGCRRILCGQDVLVNGDVKRQLIDAQFPLKAINKCLKPSKLCNNNNDWTSVVILIGVLILSK